MKTKFKLPDVVTLLKGRDNLVTGQVGTIVEIFDEENFEVEFGNTSGNILPNMDVICSGVRSPA